MAGTDCFKHITEAVVAVSALGGLVVAIVGLSTWRRQLKGRAEYELARRLLRCVYGLRDSIIALRAPFMSSVEITNAKQKALKKLATQETPAPEIDGVAATFAERWDFVQARHSDLQVELLEAEVIWGKDAVSAAEDLRGCVRDLYAHLTIYIRERSPEATPKFGAEVIKKAESFVFPIPDETGVDQFANRLSKAVEKIEGFVRPKLKK